jgi:Eco57I restriction-modification methylase
MNRLLRCLQKNRPLYLHLVATIHRVTTLRTISCSLFLSTHSTTLIAEKLKDSDPEKAILSLRVADISSGSGHILLAAARRIATELAIVRTGEEQPSPVAFRTAVRDVIRECIYGVDVNPLAVELCKVALWLEAHNPGEPLNFLDHHIKCGNAIVGFARRTELDRGVPDEAFVTMPGDDKEVAASFRKRNKAERTAENQTQLNLSPEIQKHLEEILRRWREISALPERTPHEIESKKHRYLDFTRTQDALILSQIACIPIAQFYLKKTLENRSKLITDAEFRLYLSGQRHPQGQATATAWATAFESRFFHWFLEFPEIIERGGFDCVLGNPPYLGGQDLSGTFGHSFCHYVKWEYAPAGLSDLVVYFVRRIYSLLRPGGFTAFITTNSIKDGDIRKDGLEQILAQGGAINFAVRAIKWPGRANVFISLVSIHKGEWSGKRFLDGREVPVVSAYFEDSLDIGDALQLTENADRVFQGSIFLGDGFLLSHEEAEGMKRRDPRLRDVIFPVIKGQELNNRPDQAPGRQIINFFDWPLEKAEKCGEKPPHGARYRTSSVRSNKRYYSVFLS